MPTTTLDDYPTSAILRGSASIALIALVLAAVAFKIAHPVIVVQFALLASLGVAWLMWRDNKWIPVFLTSSFIASGIMLALPSSNAVIFGITILVAMAFTIKRIEANATLSDDDDELSLTRVLEPLDEHEIELLRSLKPQLQRIVEDLDGESVEDRLQAVEYITSIEHAVDHGFAGDVMAFYQDIGAFIDGELDGPN